MTEDKRPNWHTYFMKVAEMASTRATCPRKSVGAVIVRDRAILSTGYNGSVRGLPHCIEDGCMMEDNHCVRVIHAEVNALLQAAKHGTRVDEATIYTTASPCWNCFKSCINAGIQGFVFKEFYRDDRIFKIAETLSVKLLQLSDDGSVFVPS